MGNSRIDKLSAAGLLITLGIIYGDIGTSPLYVMNAIVGSKVISETLVLGGISAVFWTLTIQTTLKYVLLTLQADNKGEGGIFSLFSLLRRRFSLFGCWNHGGWRYATCRWNYYSANFGGFGY